MGLLHLRILKKADEQIESVTYSAEKDTSSIPLCSVNSMRSDFTDKFEESTQYKEVMGQLSTIYQHVLQWILIQSLYLESIYYKMLL